MVQWNDPSLKIRLQLVNVDVIFLLLGLYGWEYFSTLDLEYAVLRGRLAFRLSWIPYLLGRAFQFIFLLLTAIKTSPPSDDFNCLPVAVLTAVSGNIALGSASLNLMIRTWVIWKDSRFVHLLLLALTVGHWVVLALDIANLQGGRERIGTCTVIIAHPAVNAAVFLYSLCYDFLVLVLSIAGLSRQPSKSSLRKRLRAQGVVYFVVVVAMYITPTVFAFLGENVILVMTGLAATTTSTIASCRLVRLLLGSSQTSEDSVALTSQIPIYTAPTQATMVV